MRELRWVVDYSSSSPYLHRMANRLFLTLLALLTGLAAQLGPADARTVQVASMEVAVLGDLPATKAPRAPVALARLPEPGRLNTRRHAVGSVVVPAAPAAPAVLTGIDRARE